MADLLRTCRGNLSFDHSSRLVDPLLMVTREIEFTHFVNSPISRHFSIAIVVVIILFTFDNEVRNDILGKKLFAYCISIPFIPQLINTLFLSLGPNGEVRSVVMMTSATPTITVLFSFLR